MHRFLLLSSEITLYNEETQELKTINAQLPINIENKNYYSVECYYTQYIYDSGERHYEGYIYNEDAHCFYPIITIANKNLPGVIIDNETWIVSKIGNTVLYEPAVEYIMESKENADEWMQLLQ